MHLDLGQVLYPVVVSYAAGGVLIAVVLSMGIWGIHECRKRVSQKSNEPGAYSKRLRAGPQVSART